ncbi:MAG: family acetyltransferase [Solirubrobacterales bacterium]|nr:family acetyltransferase [Solirubrobacterales bacterium]
MQVCDDPAVRAAEPAQWATTGAILADAFLTDPVWSWLLPEDVQRHGRLERFFGLESRYVALPHGLSVIGGADQGAVLVLPPGAWRTPVSVQARHLPAYARVFGRGLPRALGVLTRLEQLHLRRPHHYIAYIGVTAGARGQGLGEAMLRVVLDGADRDGLPSYLEASSPRSAALYARMGFTAIRDIRPLRSPPIRLMVREPAASLRARGSISRVRRARAAS